jgi:hypothetical protein
MHPFSNFIKERLNNPDLFFAKLTHTSWDEICRFMDMFIESKIKNQKEIMQSQLNLLNENEVLQGLNNKNSRKEVIQSKIACLNTLQYEFDEAYQ